MCPLVSIWLLHSAYGIQHDPNHDCCNFLCCSCCLANQVYQTSLNRKNPSIDGGKQFNIVQPAPVPCCYLCTTICCGPWVIADTLKKYIGMPYWLGLCCVHGTAANSILSFHYRLYDNGSCCRNPEVHLARTIFHADSVGKTSDRYLVRVMTNNVNPAGALQYGVVAQPMPPPGQVADSFTAPNCLKFVKCVLVFIL